MLYMYPAECVNGEPGRVGGEGGESGRVGREGGEDGKREGRVGEREGGSRLCWGELA